MLSGICRRLLCRFRNWSGVFGWYWIGKFCRSRFGGGNSSRHSGLHRNGFSIPHCRIQCRTEFLHALITVGGLDLQSFQYGVFESGRQLDPPGRRRHKVVLIHPFQRLGRQKSRDCCIETGRQRVNVSVWSLFASTDVLFFRRVARFEHHIQTFALITQAVSGGAEIQQLYTAIRCQDDIVRRDIPVYDAPLVDRP